MFKSFISPKGSSMFRFSLCLYIFLLTGFVFAAKKHPSPKTIIGSRVLLSAEGAKAEVVVEPVQELPKRSVGLEARFQHHFPIVSTAVLDVIRSLKDHKKKAKSLTERQKKNLGFWIKQAQKGRGLPPQLVKSDLPRGMGSGVFLRRDAGKQIPKGSFLGFYSGEYKVVYTQTVRTHEDEYSLDVSHNNLALSSDEARACGLPVGADYDMTDERFDCVLISDAKHYGNWTRFLNHSSKKPNVKLVMVRVVKNYKHFWAQVFQVIQAIKPGEQILWNYGEAYWENRLCLPCAPSTYQVDESGEVFRKPVRNPVASFVKLKKKKRNNRPARVSRSRGSVLVSGEEKRKRKRKKSVILRSQDWVS